MGVNLTLFGHDDYPSGKTHTSRIGNHAGFGVIADWIDGLPSGKYPSIESISRDHEFKPTDLLAKELNHAFTLHPPKQDDREIIDHFLDLIGVGHPDETAKIETED